MTTTASAAVSSREVDLGEDTGDRLVGICIAFIILTTLFIALRFFSRHFTVATFGLDDVFMLAAYFVDLGLCAIGIASVKLGGVGRHIQYIEEFDPEKEVRWAEFVLAFEMAHFASVALPKIAIIFMYLRILNWEGAMRHVAYVLIFLLAATSLSFIIAGFFECQPLSSWWDDTIPGTCFDIQAFFRAQSIPGAVFDLIIVVLPLRTIWLLKLPLARRIALVFLFAVGSFGVVASVIRATVFFSTSAFGDRTFASVDLLGWSVIETGSYIIAGCLPATRPIFCHYAPPWLKTTARKGLSYVGNSTTPIETGSHSTNSRSGKSYTMGRVVTPGEPTTITICTSPATADPEFEHANDDVNSPTNDDEIRLRPLHKLTKPRNGKAVQTRLGTKRSTPSSWV